MTPVVNSIRNPPSPETFPASPGDHAVTVHGRELYDALRELNAVHLEILSVGWPKEPGPHADAREAALNRSTRARKRALDALRLVKALDSIT